MARTRRSFPQVFPADTEDHDTPAANRPPHRRVAFLLVSASLFLSPRTGCALQLRKQTEGIRRARPAHSRLRAKVDAHGRPVGASEEPAAIVVRELDAADACGLSPRHARYRSRDGRRDAAGPATGATLHGGSPSSRGRGVPGGTRAKSRTGVRGTQPPRRAAPGGRVAERKAHRYNEAPGVSTCGKVSSAS